MKRIWFHLVLHLGCIVLLLAQGYRIQQFQKEKLEDQRQAERTRIQSDLRINLLANDDDINKDVASQCLEAMEKLKPVGKP
jgi:hypothetical protein